MLRALPLAIQGIWVGLVCIALLVGSAAALRSLFAGNVGAAPAPSATATVAIAIPTATATGAAPPLPQPTATTSGGASLGGQGPGVSLGGSLALRDRLSSDLRLRKFGPFFDDLDRLMAVEPAAIDRPDVRNMIADALTYVVVPLPNGTLLPEANRALTFVTERAGSAGPDILFDITTTRGGTRAQKIAEELLAKKEIQAKGTPAFRIANELRVAQSCQERTALFARVRAEGDKRVLQFLFQMARCGKRPTDCCLGNDKAYKDVIQAITAKK